VTTRGTADAAPSEKETRSQRISFPFAAVVGHDSVKLALVLAALDPALGGVLLRGEKGAAKTTLARGLSDLLPGAAPFAELPLGATEDRLVGSLDIAAALTGAARVFAPGVLAAAHEGILYVDEVNLLADHLVDILLDVSVSGWNRVEREGVSHQHPARFVLVGSMNPEEGELRPQLLDRFGLAVEITADTDPLQRSLAVRRRLDFDEDPVGFMAGWAERTRQLQARIRATSAAVLPEDLLVAISKLCVVVGAQGLRADLVVARASAAHAGWQGRTTVDVADVAAVAPLALAHRRRRSPFEDPGMTAEEFAAAFREVFGEDPPAGPADFSNEACENPQDAPAPDPSATGQSAPPATEPETPGQPPSGIPSPHPRERDPGPAENPLDPSAHGSDCSAGTAQKTGGRSEHEHDPHKREDEAATAGGKSTQPGGASFSENRKNDGNVQTSGRGRVATPGATLPFGPLAPSCATHPTSRTLGTTSRATTATTGTAGRRPTAQGDQGRLVRDRPGSGKDGTLAGPLAINATLRETALRHAAAKPAESDKPAEKPATSAGPVAGPVPSVVSSDLREAVRAQRVGVLLVLAVDASGSMNAPQRMEAVKGALLSVLLDAYQRRDRVALVTFGGEQAHLVLAPTGSVEIAQARLRGLETGGRTPLAAGLRTALQVATGERRSGRRDAWIVLVTDGRATSAPVGTDPWSLAQEAAVAVRRQGVPSAVIDVEDTNGPRLGLAGVLAETMGAQYLPLPALTVDALEEMLRGLLERPGSPPVPPAHEEKSRQQKKRSSSGEPQEQTE